MFYTSKLCYTDAELYGLLGNTLEAIDKRVITVYLPKPGNDFYK